MKGNLEPPDFETEFDKQIVVTAEKKVSVELPKIKDKDMDSYRILQYIDEYVGSFVKLRGEKEIMIKAKEEHVGNYNFSIALADINPNPQYKIYLFNLTVLSQWPGRPRPSLTLNASISSINIFGELQINFNNDI